MSYVAHFDKVDEYLVYTNSFIAGLSDPLIKQRQVGFVVVSAVSAYELAIKDIFFNFAHKKHKSFGIYVGNIFKRTSGQIKIETLKSRHIQKFGEKYLEKFNKELTKCEDYSLRVRRRSIVNSYGNIIVWRNNFVHEGIVVDSASYEEAVQSYHDGKEVIHALFRIMVR